MHVHNVGIRKENPSVKLLNEIPFTVLMLSKIVNEPLLTVSKLLCNSGKTSIFKMNFRLNFKNKNTKGGVFNSDFKRLY